MKPRVSDWLVPIGLSVWFTVLCGGFAWIYWTGAWVDPRDIFPSLLSDVGAVMVFPVGWVYLVAKAWDEFG